MTTVTKKAIKADVYKSIIDLFGKAVIIETASRKVSFKNLTLAGLRAGYIIHPDLSNEFVSSWIADKAINYNSTFYKQWYDVISGKYDVYEEAVRHYASTYGTGFQGEPYVINDGAETPNFTSLKVLSVISEEEVIEKCIGMFYSGIPLKEETINKIISILMEFGAIYSLDINKVRNKEAKLILCELMDVLPNDPVEMVRYLVYVTTKKTTVIKNQELITLMKKSDKNVSGLIEKFGEAKLSSVFNRYKPIFLALKSVKKNRTSINTLRRLADKNHVPYEGSYFETLLSQEKVDLAYLAERLKTTTNFTKAKILQAILFRKVDKNHDAFGIRNGKLWMQPSNGKKVSTETHDAIYGVVYQSLVESLAKKACSVKVSKDIDLKLPISEKSFIGNFPIGTTVDISQKDTILGIHWRQSEGTSDFDFSLIDIDAKKYGWNAHYSNGSNLIFSGDMTYAEPEATELFYLKNGSFKPSICKVNRFRGQKDSKFRIFIAKEHVEKLTNNYMVDPNNILFTVDCISNSKEKMIGVVAEGKFVLAEFRTGNAIVSGKSITNNYTDYTLKTIGCYLSLNQILTDAGFKFVEEGADIDLSNLAKDTLISLLS